MLKRLEYIVIRRDEVITVSSIKRGWGRSKSIILMAIKDLCSRLQIIGTYDFVIVIVETSIYEKYFTLEWTFRWHMQFDWQLCCKIAFYV